MKVTVDASVHLNALNENEPGSVASQSLLQALHDAEERDEPPSVEVLSPTLLLTEVAAAAAPPPKGVERFLTPEGATPESRRGSPSSSCSAR